MDGADDSVADETGEGAPSPPTHPRSLAQGPRAQRKHTHPPTGATATEPLAAASPAMGVAALGDVLQAVDEELGVPVVGHRCRRQLLDGSELGGG